MVLTAGPGFARTYGTNSVTSGENYTLLLPTNWAADATVPGIVYCHGFGEGAVAGWDDTNKFGQTDLLRRLARAGYPVLVCDLGGQLWGYSPLTSRIDDAITYLQGTVKARAGKVVLIGTSMGGDSCLKYAFDKPSKVACLTLLAPVSDITWTVANNAGLAASINSVYPSGWSEGTYGASYNPITIATAGGYVGMPMQVWQGVSDLTVPLARSQALVAQVATATLTQLPGDHSETTWSEVDPGQVLNFIAAHT